MKLIDEKKQEKAFQPFELNIMVESEEEALLFYMIFDNVNLKQTLLESTREPEKFFLASSNFTYSDRNKVIEYLTSKGILNDNR